MKEFLNNSTLIFKNIQRLREMVDEMEKYMLFKQNSVMTDEKEEALEAQIDRLDNNFDVMCESIKEEIKRTREETDKLEKAGLSQSEMNLRNTHIFKYSKELTEAIGLYRNLKCDYKNKEKEQLREAFRIANPQANEPDLEKFIESDGTDLSVGTAFTMGSKSAQSSMLQAKNRKKRLDKIVVSINKLVLLIEEIDELVHRSTEVVDEILVHITDAEANTIQANKELESALAWQRKRNLIKKIIASIVFIAIFIAILFGGKWIYNFKAGRPRRW